MWRVAAAGGPAELWFQSPLLLGTGDFGPASRSARTGSPSARTNSSSPTQRAGGSFGSASTRTEVRAPQRCSRKARPSCRDGIAFDVHGNVWVAVIAQSTIVSVSPSGTITTVATAADGLDWASSLAFGKDHDLWAVNFAIGPPGGPGPALLPLAVEVKGSRSLGASPPHAPSSLTARRRAGCAGGAGLARHARRGPSGADGSVLNHGPDTGATDQAGAPRSNRRGQERAAPPDGAPLPSRSPERLHPLATVRERWSLVAGGGGNRTRARFQSAQRRPQPGVAESLRPSARSIASSSDSAAPAASSDASRSGPSAASSLASVCRSSASSRIFVGSTETRRQFLRSAEQTSARAGVAGLGFQRGDAEQRVELAPRPARSRSRPPARGGRSRVRGRGHRGRVLPSRGC